MVCPDMSPGTVNEPTAHTESMMGKRLEAIAGRLGDIDRAAAKINRHGGSVLLATGKVPNYPGLAQLIPKDYRARVAESVYRKLNGPNKGGILSPAAATKDQPYVNSLGMRFVPVPTGDGPPSRKKVLFSIWETRRQDYEVYANVSRGVDGEWKNVLLLGQPVGHEPLHPVVSVSGEDAEKFCQWITEKERASGKIGREDTYRLPTDEEWSFAVGIGEREDQNKAPWEKDMKITKVYPWNSGKGTWPPPDRVGNYADSALKAKFGVWPVIEGYDDGYATTAPVGSFPANANGLFDLGGNVWEWCGDSYNGKSGSRMFRGGSFDDFLLNRMLSSFRGGNIPDSRFHFLGFRCVLVVFGP